MNTIGVVAGSFDPITWGHAWLISEAARLVDRLHIVIGVNPAKKYLFTEDERAAMVLATLADTALFATPFELHFLKHDLLAQFATRIRATHLVRGIRNAEDFSYETQMASVNRKIAPDVRTVYLAPPPDLSEVSSSTVKGLVGFTDWEAIVGGYVHPAVLQALAQKNLQQQGDRA